MTSIANAMPCPRRPILQSMVRQSGPASKSMLYGTILHGLLQRALSEQTFDLDSTRLRLDEDLSKEDRKLEMWGAKLGFEDVKLEVGEKARIGFETFGRKWIGSTPMVNLANYRPVFWELKFPVAWRRASRFGRRKALVAGYQWTARHRRGHLVSQMGSQGQS